MVDNIETAEVEMVMHEARIMLEQIDNLKMKEPVEVLEYLSKLKETPTGLNPMRLPQVRIIVYLLWVDRNKKEFLKPLKIVLELVLDMLKRGEKSIKPEVLKEVLMFMEKTTPDGWINPLPYIVPEEIKKHEG